MKPKQKRSPHDRGLHEHTSIVLTKEDRAWLNARAEETGATLGAILRLALRAYRETLDKKKAA